MPGSAEERAHPSRAMIVALMAVHLETIMDVVRLNRCLESIKCQETPISRLFISISFSTSNSVDLEPHWIKIRDLITTTHENRASADSGLLPIEIRESPEPLKQFEHYQLLSEQLESLIQEDETFPPAVPIYVMFSDGDDIWDARRLSWANTCMTTMRREGLKPDFGTPFPYLNRLTNGTGERLIGEQLKWHSYVFCNADGPENAKVRTSKDVQQDLYSTDGCIAYHHPRIDSWDVMMDLSSCDAEYWACIVPYSVFRSFFQDFRKDSPVLKHPYCDLLFGQYIRDNGFIDVTEVVENGGDKFRMKKRMDQPWSYCHLADERKSKPSDDPFAMHSSTVSVLLSLSPRERTIERLEQRLSKCDKSCRPRPQDIMEIVEYFDVKHILGELVQSLP